MPEVAVEMGSLTDLILKKKILFLGFIQYYRETISPKKFHRDVQDTISGKLQKF